MEVTSKVLPLTKLENNTGQIKGVPKNPRFIKDYRYHKLKQSIVEDPEMLDLRELLVFPMKDKFVVIAGNQRLAVCRELKFKETLCKILPADTPTEKLKRYIIKDNIPFGEADWDALANEWDETDLIDWGLEIPNFGNTATEQEWKDMPEFTQEDKTAFRSIIIHFATQDHVNEFAELLKQSVSEKTKYLWYPEQIINDTESKRY